MLELIVLARRDAKMRRFLNDLRHCPTRQPLRQMLITHPSSAPRRALPGVVRWLIVDEDSLARRRTSALVARLASAGTLRIGVRVARPNTQRSPSVPAGLRSLAEGSASLMMFRFNDRHFDLMKKVVGMKRPSRHAAAGCGTPPGVDAMADPLYERALALAASHGCASLSLIQRSFGIGYSRAQLLADEIAGAAPMGEYVMPALRPDP